MWKANTENEREERRVKELKSSQERFKESKNKEWTAYLKSVMICMAVCLMELETQFIGANQGGAWRTGKVK